MMMQHLLHRPVSPDDEMEVLPRHFDDDVNDDDGFAAAPAHTMGHYLSLEQQQGEEEDCGWGQYPQHPQPHRQEPHQRRPAHLTDWHDVLAVLKSQETLYYNNDRSGPSLRPHLSESWRPVMVSWLFSVVDTFGLMPHVVSTAVHHLDRYGPVVPTSDYPLMAMAALNVAVKCHETKMFPLDQLVRLMGGGNGSNGLAGDGGDSNNNPPGPYRYTPDDVIEMERTILRESRWRLHPPTAHDFLNQYVEAVPEQQHHHNIGDGQQQQRQQQQREAVLAHAVSNLKNAYMWEHVLHQQQEQQQQGGGNNNGRSPQRQQQQKRQHARSFAPSTLAYAALLLVLEDAGVSLDDKQTACRVLLEAVDVSAARTPYLSEAYNWLVLSKGLQEQLVVNQLIQQQQQTQQQYSTVTEAVVVTLPAPVEAVVVVEQAEEELIFDLTEDQARIAGDSDTPDDNVLTTMDAPAERDLIDLMDDDDAEAATGGDDDDASLEPGPIDLTDDNTVGAVAPDTYIEHGPIDLLSADMMLPSQKSASPSEDDRDAEEVDESELELSDCSSEVIFFTQTYSGDGFEVVSDGSEGGGGSMMTHVMYDDDNDADDDEEGIGGGWSDEIRLVLTESLDDDGFEVSYANDWKHDDHSSMCLSKDEDRLSSLLASPRMVTM